MTNNTKMVVGFKEEKRRLVNETGYMYIISHSQLCLIDACSSKRDKLGQSQCCVWLGTCKQNRYLDHSGTYKAKQDLNGALTGLLRKRVWEGPSMIHTLMDHEDKIYTVLLMEHN